MKLPVVYADLLPQDRRLVRSAYIRLQEGRCYHCKAPLISKPRHDVLKKPVNPRLFPPNFFHHPVHLHHSHDTGLTIGAVHCHCNAVLWQYHGE